MYILIAQFKAAGWFCQLPHPGDIAFWSYGDGHAEFFESVPAGSHSVIYIGGNTSSGDGSPDNGGEVARKNRIRDGQCLGFGRPNYSKTLTENDDMPPTFSITNPTGPGYWVVRRIDGAV